MYLIQKIEELSIKSEDARRGVAEFVLEHASSIHEYTIERIAEETFTSKATVTRFAKMLGFQGWRDFLKAFVSECRRQEGYADDIDVNFPFGKTDDVHIIAENIRRLKEESLKDTENMLDVNMLHRAVNRMVSARRIVLITERPNMYFARAFRWKMLSIGRNVEIVESGEMGLVSYSLGASDMVIMISYSGNNPYASPMNHLATLLERNVMLVGITSVGDNYIRRNVDCILTISSRERLYSKISNFATEESIDYLLDLLFSCYYAREYEKNRSFRENSAKELERSRTTVLQEMKER